MKGFLQFAFSAAMTVLLAVGILAYRTSLAADESERWLRHTNDVLDSLQEMQIGIQTIVADVRGFILTGNEVDHRSHEATVVRITVNEANFRRLTIDNAAQQNRLPELDRLIATIVERVATAQALRADHGREAATAYLRDGTDHQVDGRFASLIQEMRDEESRLLDQRTKALDQLLGQWRTLTLLGALLALSITAAAALGAQRLGARRKLAEDARGESEQKYRMLVDSVQDYGIFMLDPVGRILSWNAGAEHIKGYTADEIVGQNFARFFPPDEIEQGRPAAMLQLAALHGRHEDQSMRVRKDGTRFLANVTIASLRDEDGTLRGFSEVSHDLTNIAEAEARYRGLLEAAPDAMVIVDPQGTIVLLNAQAEQRFGYSRDELVGRAMTVIIPHGFAERLAADGLRSTVDVLAQMGAGIELCGRRKDGSDFPIELMLSPLTSSSGILVTAALRDITVRKEAERKIVYLNRVYAMLSGINALIVRVRDREELFGGACRLAVDAGDFPMAMICMAEEDPKAMVGVAWAGTDERVLASLKEILAEAGREPDTMISRAVRDRVVVVSNDTRNDPWVLFGEAYARAGVRSLAVLPLILGGETVGALVLCAADTEFFHDAEMKLLTQLAGDISFAIDHIGRKERLDYIAHHDVLTGLANRTLFCERLEQNVANAAEHGRRLALVLLDIERFMSVNDTIGRSAGDQLLAQIAGRLSSHAAGDRRLARFDADNFAIMVPELNSEEELARRIEQLLAKCFGPSFTIGDAELRVTARYGIAVFPNDGADSDTLIHNAEAALKKAKEGGDRYLFYTQAMNERVAEKFAMEYQLRQALDNREFVLHYQPKVDLVGGKVTGAEALIRWNHPQSGLVPPGRFISVLEETGLIYEVGRWALGQAIDDYLRWRAIGLPPSFRIAVNVSPLQMRNRAFEAEIRQVVGIDPHATTGLELEITESLIMQDVEQSIECLTELRKMGISIAIDDFGTGFSSLSYLSRLPIDTLKIDRSFIVDMTASSEGLALVSTIIGLARALRLKVVAEGVETDEQVRLLRLIACAEMQGFVFSKPLPRDLFESRYLHPQPSGAKSRLVPV